MRNFFRIHDVGIKELLIVGLVLLGGYTVWLHRQLVGIAYQKVSDKVEQVMPPRTTVIDTCGIDCQKEIDKKVGEALRSSPVPAKNRASTSGVAAQKTSYISIGSSFVTRNADWVDVPGQVTVDPGAYGMGPQFYFDASVKIGNGNGQVSIRLFDVTNGIAVSGSELSATTADFSNVSSGNLPLWNGNNTYKVQIKSSSGQEATFASGRIRVVYH